jgi:hypothetical protein
MDGFCKWISVGVRFLWVQNEAKIILSQSQQSQQVAQKLKIGGEYNETLKG